MNEFERLDDLLNCRDVDRPPVICPMHSGTTALMKASTAFFPEVQDDPLKMARLAKAGHDVAGFENVRVPFDESVEISAFGIRTGPKGLQRLPLVLQHRIKRAEDIDDLHVPDPKNAPGKVPTVLKAIEILQDDMEDVPIFLGITTPLMMAMQLRGEHDTLLDMRNDPDMLKRLLEKSTSFILDYIREAAEMGVDQIVLDDPLSNSDILTFEQFRQFVEPYVDRLANEMRKQDVESILHVCGNVPIKQLSRIVEIDVDALSIDEMVPITSAKELASKRNMMVMGNISPSKTLLMGNKVSVREATKKSIDEGVDAVAPGCNLEMYTPVENLRTMTMTAKRYGAKRAGRRA